MVDPSAVHSPTSPRPCVREHASQSTRCFDFGQLDVDSASIEIGVRFEIQPDQGNGEPPVRDDAGRPLEERISCTSSTLKRGPPKRVLRRSAPRSKTGTAPALRHDRGSDVTREGDVGNVEVARGIGFGLVHVGGGDAADKAALHAEAKRLNVPLVCMPRLSQPALVGLVRTLTPWSVTLITNRLA